FWLIDEGHRLARGGPNCKRQNASAPASSVYTIAIRRYRPPKHGNTENRPHELVLLGLCPWFHLLRPLADFPLEDQGRTEATQGASQRQAGDRGRKAGRNEGAPRLPETGKRKPADEGQLGPRPKRPRLAGTRAGNLRPGRK